MYNFVLHSPVYVKTFLNYIGYLNECLYKSYCLICIILTLSDTRYSDKCIRKITSNYIRIYLVVL